MTTWRDVPWEYGDDGGVYARMNGAAILVCYVTLGNDRATIGRAIAHAWNMDLAQTQWARELFGDDSVRTRES